MTTHITFMPKTNFFLCIGDLIPSLCSRSVILILANWSPWFTSFFKSVLYIPEWMNEWTNEWTSQWMNESVLYIPRPKLSIHTQSTSRDQSENGFLLKVWALFVDQPSRPPAVARNPPRLEKTKIHLSNLNNVKNASLGIRSPCLCPKSKYVYLIWDQNYVLCMNGYLCVNHPCTPLDFPIIDIFIDMEVKVTKI